MTYFCLSYRVVRVSLHVYMHYPVVPLGAVQGATILLFVAFPLLQAYIYISDLSLLVFTLFFLLPIFSLCSCAAESSPGGSYMAAYHPQQPNFNCEDIHPLLYARVVSEHARVKSVVLMSLFRASVRISSALRALLQPTRRSSLNSTGSPS